MQTKENTSTTRPALIVESKPLLDSVDPKQQLIHLCFPTHPTPAGYAHLFWCGIWNSTLEISAREEALHQGTYQRYGDGPDPFSVEEGFSYATEARARRNWGGPARDKSFYYQQMSDAQPNTRWR